MTLDGRCASPSALANYQQLFGNDPKFYQSLRVTLYYVLLAVPISQIAALAVAMLMNTQRARHRDLPHDLLRPVADRRQRRRRGAVAAALQQRLRPDQRDAPPDARLFGTTPPDWFGRDARHWAMPGVRHHERLGRRRGDDPLPRGTEGHSRVRSTKPRRSTARGRCGSSGTSRCRCSRR